MGKLPVVWGTTLAKHEADIIGINLRHHMALGLSGIVVFDNDSRDATGEIARSVPGTVVVPDREPAFLQAEKNRAMTGVAMEHGAEWVLSIDADEFWYPVGFDDIPEAVAASGLDAFRAEMFDHVCTVYDDPEEDDPVRRMRWRCAKPSNAKAAHRCGAGIHVCGGNESVVVDGEVADLPTYGGLRIRHFPVRSFRQFKTKTIIGANAIAKVPDAGRRTVSHWKKWWRLYCTDRQGFEDFFNRRMVKNSRKLRDNPDTWLEDPFRPAGE